MKNRQDQIKSVGKPKQLKSMDDLFLLLPDIFRGLMVSALRFFSSMFLSAESRVSFISSPQFTKLEIFRLRLLFALSLIILSISSLRLSSAPSSLIPLIFSSGRKGGFFSLMLSQSTPSKKEWLLISQISFAPSRLLQSGLSSFLMKSAAVGLIMSSLSPISGQSIFCCRMFSITCSTVSSLNGRHPISISQASTPRLHQSLLGLSRHALSMIYGEMQSGVPMILVLLLRGGGLPQESVRGYLSSMQESLQSVRRTLSILSLIRMSESPKSVSLRCPFSSMTRFSGFRSRCTISKSCRCSMARMISARQNLALCYSRYTCSSRMLDRSPLGTYSNTKKWADPSLKEKDASTRYSPPILRKISCSFSIRFSSVWFHFFSIFITFIAQVSIVFFLRTRQTFPNAPLPRNFNTQKSKQQNLITFEFGLKSLIFLKLDASIRFMHDFTAYVIKQFDFILGYYLSFQACQPTFFLSEFFGCLHTQFLLAMVIILVGKFLQGLSGGKE